MSKTDYLGEVFGNSRSRNPLQVITNMFKRRSGADPLDDEFVDELSCAGAPGETRPATGAAASAATCGTATAGPVGGGGGGGGNGGGRSNSSTQRPVSANPFSRQQHYGSQSSAAQPHNRHICSPTLSLGNRLRPSSPLSIPGGCGRFRQATSAEDILSISASLRNARSLQEDMELLRQSRQDNPYIQQQIEKFSILSEGLSRFDGHSLHHQEQAMMSDSPAAVPEDHQQLLFSSSPKDEDILSLTSQMDNRHEDLHQHLIRSPPPMFPQDVEQFVFEFSRTTSPQHLIGSPCSVRTQRQATDSHGLNTPERGKSARCDALHSRRSQDESSHGTPPLSHWPGSTASVSGQHSSSARPLLASETRQMREGSIDSTGHVPILAPPIKAWKRCTSPLSKDLEQDQESLLIKSFDSAF